MEFYKVEVVKTHRDVEGCELKQKEYYFDDYDAAMHWFEYSKKSEVERFAHEEIEVEEKNIYTDYSNSRYKSRFFMGRCGYQYPCFTTESVEFVTITNSDRTFEHNYD